MILIVTNKLDPHTDIVSKELNKRGESFFRFNTEDFPNKISLTIYGNSGGFLSGFNRVVDLISVRSVWYRRPCDSVVSELIQDQSLVNFVVRECKTTLSNLWDLLAGSVFWVNHPKKNLSADSKLLQLVIAEKLCVRTPATIVTSNPEEALLFLQKHKDAVAKTISSGFIERKNSGGGSVIYTNRITCREFEKLELVKYSPTLFQEYIQKEFELRITIVGERIFACRIDSQKSDRTKDDWRRYDFNNVPHSIFKLPRKIELFCVNFLQTFGLNFGTIDMIVTPDGDYVFLEINPNGQWGWIESLTGMPISKALADLLIAGKSQ